MLSARRLPQPKRSRQRGLSIVEMMVGVTIGLIVVAAASLVVTTQLLENRKLLTETQLQQDLRAASDIITRELRRSGAWAAPQLGIATATTSPQPNIYAQSLSPSSGIAGQVDYRYQRTTADTGGPFGFRLSGGIIQSNIGSTWQDLTDGNTMRVTAFEVQPANSSAMQLPCPRPCSDGTTTCWPSIVVRSFVVRITASAKNDPAVTRTMSTSVRLRNDLVRFNDAANPLQFCPS